MKCAHQTLNPKSWLDIVNKYEKCNRKKNARLHLPKYTGQEDSQVRERIQTTTPNIILTKLYDAGTF